GRDSSSASKMASGRAWDMAKSSLLMAAAAAARRRSRSRQPALPPLVELELAIAPPPAAAAGGAGTGGGTGTAAIVAVAAVGAPVRPAAHVEALHVLVGQELLGVAVEDDPPILHDGAGGGDRQRQVGVLLDQQDGRPLLLIDP